MMIDGTGGMKGAREVDTRYKIQDTRKQEDLENWIQDTRHKKTRGFRFQDLGFGEIKILYFLPF
jgi:hypothetical protein